MSDQDRDAALRPGTLIGPYRIEHRVGGGGVGDVYAAIEPTIRTRVAIKVLRRSFTGDDAAAARFEREARAANDIRHPAIVEVFGFGKLDDGRPYLVMSLLEGRSLRAEVAARGRLPPREAWVIAREVAGALAAAHRAGIVHRDLKPDNIFLERYGAEPAPRPPRARVLDFGLAKLHDAVDGAGEQPMKLTQTGAPVGTPAYMAPEQWWCAGIGPRTDQYALGAVLFEMLTGRAPFDSQQFVELVQAHLHQKPPTLSERGTDLGLAAEAFVARALAKDPERRFDSMDDLIADGDAAFTSVTTEEPGRSGPATELGHAHTEVTPAASASRDLSQARATPDSAARALVLRRLYAVHLFLLLGGCALFVGVGYAGPARHDVFEWFRIAGQFSLVAVALFLGAGVGFVFVARARARDGGPSTLGVWLAILPGLAGAVGTYFGWNAIQGALERMPELERFATFNQGMYEANASRFLGFLLSTLLCLGLAALPGVSCAPRRGESVPAGIERRVMLAACVGLAILSLVSAFTGAPSGALITAVAAATLALGLVLPIRSGAVQGELARLLAGILALGLAVAAGFARIEAREAVLWGADLTRAERAGEMVAAASERGATVVIALACLALIAALSWLRIRRLWKLLAPFIHLKDKWILLVVLLLAAVGDQAQHVRFLAQRERLREDLAPQFALFAQLDPPSSADLDRSRFAPHRAVAMQIGRVSVAINSKGVARLAALESADGAANVGRDLSHALALPRADVHPGAPDLAVSVDRKVPYRTVLRLLSIARDAGVRRVELLFTRGAAPALSIVGPAEASYVLASDFVALRATLGDDGFTAPDAEAAFGKVAPSLVSRALATKGSFALAVPRR